MNRDSGSASARDRDPEMNHVPPSWPEMPEAYRSEFPQYDVFGFRVYNFALQRMAMERLTAGTHRADPEPYPVETEFPWPPVGGTDCLYTATLGPPVGVAGAGGGSLLPITGVGFPLQWESDLPDWRPEDFGGHPAAAAAAAEEPDPAWEEELLDDWWEEEKTLSSAGRRTSRKQGCKTIGV